MLRDILSILDVLTVDECKEFRFFENGRGGTDLLPSIQSRPKLGFLLGVTLPNLALRGT